MSTVQTNEALLDRLVRLEKIYEQNVDNREQYRRDIQHLVATEYELAMDLKLGAYSKFIRRIPYNELLPWLRRIVTNDGIPDKLKQEIFNEIEDLVITTKDGLKQREEIIEKRQSERQLKEARARKEEEERARQEKYAKNQAIFDSKKNEAKRQLQVVNLAIDNYKKFMGKTQIYVAIVMVLILILSIILATTLHENLYILMILLPLGYGVMHMYKYVMNKYNQHSKTDLEHKIANM